jgi:hypothetical protein
MHQLHTRLNISSPPLTLQGKYKTRRKIQDTQTGSVKSNSAPLKYLYIFTTARSRKLTCFELQPYANFLCYPFASYDIQQKIPLFEEIKIGKEKK